MAGASPPVLLVGVSVTVVVLTGVSEPSDPGTRKPRGRVDSGAGVVSSQRWAATGTGVRVP
ncbi:hypothetical protein GCM10023201_50950 [Actinomycetospora corticicola]